jgi:hypothetical protein
VASATDGGTPHVVPTSKAEQEQVMQVKSGSKVKLSQVWVKSEVKSSLGQKMSLCFCKYCTLFCVNVNVAVNIVTGRPCTAQVGSCSP